MRRYFSLIGITCALTLSGWGGALAAMLCPHAPNARADADTLISDARLDDAHACCRLSKKGASVDGGEAHCSGATGKGNDASTRNEASSHQKVVRQKAIPHQEVSRPEHHSFFAERGSHHAAGGFAVGNFPCGHCVERPEQIPAFVRARASGEAKHDISSSAAHAQKALRAVVSSFTKTTSSSRGEPPGNARRHLLISVFLI